MVVQLVTGGFCVGLALAIRLFFASHITLGAIEPVVLPLGLMIILLTVFPARGARREWFVGGCVSMWAVFVTMGLAEVAFRAVGFDFRQQEMAWRRLPPYFRVPRTPTGEVYFRHEGPETWTGAAIRRRLELERWPVPEAYRSEPTITVVYDALGFRGEEPLDDWEIAVAGDSFTELGCLSHTQLFTTILAWGTGQRVRNLGVSSTGPLTHVSYLRDYGVSRSLREAVIVFFEGNDLRDLHDEHTALLHFEATGERPFRFFEKQPSLIEAIGEAMLPSERRNQQQPDQLPRFEFASANGPVPVDVVQVAPGLDEISPENRAQLDRFLAGFRTFGRERGVRTWLAYMPCKGRVLHGRLRSARGDGAGSPLWTPTELPGLIADECRRRGIGFIDLTPVLVEAAQARGELVFNPLMDIHLNARGSELVGAELVRWFRGQPGL